MGIERELGFRKHEDTILKPAVSEHNAVLNMWILVDNAFYTSGASAADTEVLEEALYPSESD